MSFKLGVTSGDGGRSTAAFIEVQKDQANIKVTPMKKLIEPTTFFNACQKLQPPAAGRLFLLH